MQQSFRKFASVAEEASLSINKGRSTDEPKSLCRNLCVGRGYQLKHNERALLHQETEDTEASLPCRVPFDRRKRPRVRRWVSADEDHRCDQGKAHPRHMFQFRRFGCSRLASRSNPRRIAIAVFSRRYRRTIREDSKNGCLLGGPWRNRGRDTTFEDLRLLVYSKNFSAGFKPFITDGC